jgi:two-component system, cell cycle sensor histidine kinase and response regulator CckA
MTMKEKRKENSASGGQGPASEGNWPEERFRGLFQECPVSLWEEDITDLKGRLDGLRKSGIGDLRTYFADHPEEVGRCAGLIRVIGVNKATLDLYEAPDENSLLAGLSSIFTEESFAAFRDIVIALFEGRTQFENEGTNRTLRGKKLKVGLKGSLLPDSRGELTRVLLSVVDLTERKRIEEERRNNDLRLSRGQAISHVGDWEWDIATNAVHWSDELYRIYGFQPREVVPDYGLVLAQMHPASKEEFLQAIDAALKEDRHFEMDYRFLRKDGTDAVLHTIGQVFRDASGAPVRMAGTVQDITRQKEAERRLRDSEDRFRSIFENAIDGIMIADAGTKMNIEANKAMCAMMGYTREELLRLPVSDVHPKEALPAVLNAFERQLRGEISLAADIPMLRKDGTVFSADVNAVAVTLGGRPCLIGIFRDITDRKRAEEESDRLARAVSIVTEGIAVTDEQDRFIYLNDAHANTYGYRQSELMGKTWRDVTPRKFVPLIEQEMARTLHSREIGVWSGESPGLRRDGTEIATEVTATSRWSEKGEYAGHICVVRDITERKRAEEKLRQSESFVRNILDTVDEEFIVLDRDYRIVTANRAYSDQVGMSCDEVIGRHCYEISHKASRPCYEDGEECSARHAFATGEPHAALHKHAGRDGQMLYVETKAFPLRDEAGTVTSVIKTINNITERHLLEEERLKTQKLESIGTLAGGIAHDFNNLLQGVFGYISMAKLTFEQKERSLAMLEQAEKALHQSVSLTSQLLTFSKGGKPLKKAIALRPVIEDAVKFALSGSRVDYKLAVADDLRMVEADAGQIGQVVQNIVLNADQAMPVGGTIEIAVRNVDTPEDGAPRHPAAGKHVEITFRDTGVGIPEQYLSKIFDPYFTTKEKGSGLGLATAYSIIKNHGGAIDVRSKVGEGSTFTVRLPASALRPEPPVRLPARDHGKGGRILIMDDEEVVRKVAGELLRSLGYDVEAAEHGESVLVKYREARAAGRPFDVVILDLTIRGGMGGAETMRKLLEVDPGVKAIVSSGYSDDTVVSNYRDHGFAAFLKKPYDLTGLQAKLNELLR